MTISFSGLASGLDTSSWVQSLVALKQAKVTTLEKEKEEVLISKDTLNSIKAFFSSFRSTIERITDSKFNIVTMDMFAQNLATSANLDVFTASATTDAEEATYQIKVDKLATNTKAVSTYKTTVEKTTTATSDSLLKHIGVTAGNIGVTVDGIKHGITITESETMGSFIEKLKAVGVEASFNSATGVFSMNLNPADIDDIGNTGIVDKLNLEGVNEGYKTIDKLEIVAVESEWDFATNNTLLTELGVQVGTMVIEANGAQYDVTVDNVTTIGQFVAALRANNMDANFDEATGIFTLADASIINEGGTNIIDAMKLSTDIYSASQKTNPLLHETIVTQTTTATSDTLLKDIGTGTAITDGQTVIIKNSNNELTTINVGTGTSIGDLLSAMTNAGLYAEINSSGVIEISGGSIVGGTFDAVSALGLEAEPFTAMTNGDPLTETIIEYELVTYDTRLVDDLGVTEGYLAVEDPDGNTYYQKIYSGQTIGDLMADLANNGIYSTLDMDTGILEITGGAFTTLTDADVQALVANNTIAETDPRYRKGTNLLECLYGAGTISTDQISVASAYSRTQVLTKHITTIVDATLDTTLGTLGLAANGTATFNARGESKTINVTTDMTVQGLMDALAAQGIESSWDADFSRITINNSTLTGGSSNLADVLNLTTELTGKYVTSDALHSETTIIVNATRETTFEELGVTTNETVVLVREDGTNYTFNVTGTTTMGSFLDTLNANGVTAKIEDGIFSIEGGYIVNTAIEDALGLEHTVLGYSQVLGNQIVHTIITTATGDSTVGDIITALGTGSAVASGYNMYFNSTALNVSANTTVDELMVQIHNLGGSSSIDSAGRLHIDGGTLSGTVATALGFSSVTTTDSVAATGEILATITTVNADTTTKLSALGLGASTVTVKGDDGVTIGTITTHADMTIGDLFTALAGYGISGTIKDGVVTLTSDGKRYATGGVIASMGISTTDSSYTTTAGVVNTSTAVVSVTYSVTADSSTTLGSLGLGASTITVQGVDGVAVGTITTNAAMTVGDVLTALAGYGISGTIKDGYVYLDSDIGNYATGGVLGSMGVGTTITTSTTTAGVSNTSTAVVSVTYTTNADYNTTFRELGFTSGLTENVESLGGSESYMITMSADATLGDYFAALAAYGIEAEINNGIVSMKSVDGYCLHEASGVMDYWGMTGSITNTTTTGGTSASSSAALTYSTTTYETTFPTLTRTLITTSTIVTTDPVIGSQTVTVRDTVTVVEPVIGTQTITINHSHTSTVANIGTQTITVTDTVTVPVANVGTQTLLITHRHVCTEAVIGSQTIYITSSVVWTSTMTKMTTISASYSTDVVSNWTKTVTVSVDGEVVQTIPGTDTYVTTPAGYTTINCGSDTEFGELVDFNTSERSMYMVLQVVEYSTRSFTITVSAEDTMETMYDKIRDVLESTGAGYFEINRFSSNTGISIREASSSVRAYLNLSEDGAWSQIFKLTSHGSQSGAYSAFQIKDKVTVYQEETVTTIPGTPTLTTIPTSTTGSTVISGSTTTPVSWSFSTVVQEVTGTRSVTSPVVATITVEKTTTTVVTHQTVTTTVIEKTTTAPVTYTVSDSFVVNTVSYRTVTHNLSTTTVVEKTTTKTSTYTVEQTFTVEYTSTKPVTITVLGTAVYSTTTVTVTPSTSTYTADESSKLSQLGMTATGTVTVVSGGTQYTVTVNVDDTIGDMIASLAGLGIYGSIQGGILNLRGDKDAYITGFSSGIATALKVTGGLNNTYSTTLVYSYWSTTNSTVLSHSTTNTMTTDDTLARQGLTANGTITVVQDGSEVVVTVKTSDTIDDMLTSLSGLGIYGFVNGGKITFQGDNESYIKGISANLNTVLKLGTTNYATTGHTTTSNTTSSQQRYNTTNTMTTDDTLSRQGLTANGTITVVQDGSEVVVTVKTSDTIDDMLTSLSGLGIYGFVNGGLITFQGDSESYIKGISANLNTVLKLGTTNYATTGHTTTTNTNSNQQKETITAEATGTTQLQYLRHPDGTVVPGYEFILSTTSDAGNQLVTINFAATDTVYDVMDRLAQYGIQANIDCNGLFSVHSSSLTDFDISGSLGTFMMGAYVKRYDEGRIDSVSTNLIQQTIVNMDDDTLLSKLNITSGNILLYKDGTMYTIAIDNSKTVGDFRNLLAEYGITSDIIDGRLQLHGEGVTYLTTPASGASNLVTIFGLEHANWDLGDYSQISKNLTDTQTILHSATMDDKISELTDNAGNDFGVTAGQIYVYQDGTRNVLNINTNDTLQDLANKLSQYGISMEISSDGRLYLDGNNNSYLTTDGIATASASNILTKFNILNNWTDRYNSTSETLDYEVESDVLATGDTKLSDLQDADGNNLGITEGNYYVYQNGVRSTEEITGDTTLNDLRATMALYGMTTDFDQSGSMSVGGYNETYLATSATGGYDTNAIAILFEQWDFVNVYTSNNLEIPQDVIISMHEGTKLADINEGTYQAGYITVVKDGVQTDIELTADDTVGDLMDELSLYGFESVINANGQLIIKNTGNSLLQAYVGPNTASNALELLGIDLNSWVQTNSYESGSVSVTTTTPEMISSDRDTLLSEMGVTVGEFYIWKDGVKYTSYISTDETLGTFIDKLKSFGIETSLVDPGNGSILSIEGGGNWYIGSSASANASNVVDQLFVAGVTENYKYTGEERVLTYCAAKEDTLLSYYDDVANGLKAEGELSITVDGVTNAIQIGANDTIGSLLNKFNVLGLDATLTSDGHIIVQSGYKELLINTAGTTSNVLDTLNIEFVDDLGGFAASNDEVQQTTEEDLILSVSNYADYGTKMGLLNISDGSLTLYRDGEKATLNIDSNQTFSSLRSQIAGSFADVDIKFQDGYLTFFSTTAGVEVEVGSTTDTSNFSAVTGITAAGDGTVKSARELYCVNGATVLTTAGLFRNGDIKAGTFTIGDAEFTITDDTTLSGIISQINASDSSNASAYWDSVDGKLVIKSRTTGAALVNVEAGTSNFTDVMGLTKSEWASAADIGVNEATVTKMNVAAQEVGENARFSINGTYYTSTSNTVDSAVSRIKGVTINLKGVSTEGETTLTVERDKESVANAVSDIVDAYNALIENVDKEIKKDGTLDDQFALKLVRNQIRSLMTSSIGGAGVFRNLDQVGISLDAATAGNIRTDNINILTFDKDKFLKAFDADQAALKDLLVGTDTNKGVFYRIEDAVEQALTGASGYFSSAERSYNTQISRLDNKIKKANEAVERYRERLEAKFASMDLLISNMQNQYSSFLGM